MDNHLTRHFLTAIAKTCFTEGDSVNSPPCPPTDTHPQILPPFGGEMGIEIRSFLGRVEPWLRNGWKILARRPEFYPAGTAIHDREFFRREAELLKRFGCVRFCYGYLVLPSRMQRLNIRPSAALHVKFEAIDKPFTIAVPDVRDMVLGALFEKHLRHLFAGYLLQPDRPPTVWDEHLLSVAPLLNYATYSDWINIVPPSYQPHDFVEPTFSVEPHIGVQLRRMEVEQVRNSDPVRIMSLVNQLSDAWHLPILVYGHPDGTHLPDGYRHTADDGVEGLLKRELGCLRTCQLMFAPESGWVDLMAWLRIPTLLEKMTTSHCFHWHKPSRPRMDLIRQDSDIVQLANRVRSLDECLPEPDMTLTQTISPNEVHRIKQIFTTT